MKKTGIHWPISYGYVIVIIGDQFCQCYCPSKGLVSSSAYHIRLLSSLLLGESVDDCGGGYSESIAEMCDELNSLTTTAVPAMSNNDMGTSCVGGAGGGGVGAILIATPNGREESGTSRDCLLLNPSLSSQAHINQFK